MRKYLLGLVLAVLVCAPASAETVTLTMPDAQRRFIEVMQDFAARYKAEKNELRATKLVAARFEALEKIPKSAEFSGWYGQIAKMGTAEGKAWVVVKIKEYPFTLKTWNNTMSDYKHQSLISQKSKVFDQLADLSEGDWVKMSGKVVGEGSATERGMMTDPEWIVRFSSIDRSVVQ